MRPPRSPARARRQKSSTACAAPGCASSASARLGVRATCRRGGPRQVPGARRACGRLGGRAHCERGVPGAHPVSTSSVLCSRVSVRGVPLYDTEKRLFFLCSAPPCSALPHSHPARLSNSTLSQHIHSPPIGHSPSPVHGGGRHYLQKRAACSAQHAQCNVRGVPKWCCIKMFLPVLGHLKLGNGDKVWLVPGTTVTLGRQHVRIHPAAAAVARCQCEVSASHGGAVHATSKGTNPTAVWSPAGQRLLRQGVRLCLLESVPF